MFINAYGCLCGSLSVVVVVAVVVVVVVVVVFVVVFFYVYRNYNIVCIRYGKRIPYYLNIGCNKKTRVVFDFA
jgi:uncharacterized membrane protein YqiK